jgi:hypothetical protein
LSVLPRPAVRQARLQVLDEAVFAGFHQCAFWATIEGQRASPAIRPATG